jgi:polysaccharide biosynthesis/export protein
MINRNMRNMYKDRQIKHYLTIIVAAISLMLSCASCTSTRAITYMQGSFDTARLSQIKLEEPTIQQGDMLNIIVYSDNPQATALYNQSLITAGSSSKSAASTSDVGGASPTSAGYLVDEKGNIQFQGLGTMHVEGLTKNQLNDTLTLRMKDYLSNAYFSIRFLNYRFTMIGELTKPGVYSIPGDHITILEALGMAGDISQFGRRDNVTVIRTVDGKRQFGRLDLTKPEIMASPYFYLQQNDMIIVDPNKVKAASTDLTTRNIAIVATVVTTLAVILSLAKY